MTTNFRAERLRGVLSAFLSGERAITKQNTKQNTKLFLEAISSQPDTLRTVERLLSSPNGLKTLQLTLFSDVSSHFLNVQATELLLYMQSPDLAVVGGGSLLQSILLSIVDPPIFWNAMVEAQKAATLTNRAVQCFAWLLLQLICLPTERASDFYTIAQDEMLQESLSKSPDTSVQILGNKIKRTMHTISSRGRAAEESGPGGRHDNDSDDIRKISILPTQDELLSSDAPFLRHASKIEELDESSRLGVHIDNQFRLLREDMLRDLKDELQIALGSKKGRSRGLLIDNLIFEGATCDGRNPWALKFSCSRDLPRMPKTDRLEFLGKNQNFLRHQSVSCMVVDGQVTALVSIERDKNLLAQQPSIVCVQYTGDKLLQVLIALKKGKNIKLIQLNTAIFAYEPVLKQLQRTKLLALEDELMSLKSASASTLGTAQIHLVVDTVKGNESRELKKILKLPKSTKLDTSQTNCFVAGLSQRLSLIQGPPGARSCFEVLYHAHAT